MDTFMNQAVIVAIFMALSGGLGFTVGKLGLANIKNDILSIKAELVKVKNDIAPTKTPAPVVTPVVVPTAVPAVVG